MSDISMVTAVVTEPSMVERIAKAEEALERSGGLKMDKHSLAPWSVSKLKTLEKCPLNFYLQYVLKVKPDSDHVQDTSLSEVGTTCHRILELVVLGNSVSESFRLAKIECCEVNVDSPNYNPRNPNITQELWDTKVLNTEASIIAFSERLQNFECNNKVLQKLTELRIAVKKDWTKTGFFKEDCYFRGVIDLVLTLDNGPGYLVDIIVIDHKTYSETLFTESLRNFETQLDSYKVLFSKGVQPISGAQAGINFIRAGKLITGPYTDAEEINTKMISKLEFLLSGAVDSVKEGYGYFKHISGSACVYCNYSDHCKSKTLVGVELGTKKYFPVFWAGVAEEKATKEARNLKAKEEIKAAKAESKKLGKKIKN